MAVAALIAAGCGSSVAKLSARAVKLPSHRSEFCRADASGYDGGSLQPVVFADCEVAANRAHLEDLASAIRGNWGG